MKISDEVIVIKCRFTRKLRKLANSNPDVDLENLSSQTVKLDDIKDSSCDDIMAITKVLIACRCLVPECKIVKNGEFKVLEEQTLVVEQT